MPKPTILSSGKDDHRPGFQAALARCRQLGAVLAAARLDRITRRAHTLSQLLEDGVSVRAADMPGANDLMMRVYAAMAQKERELISESTRAALGAAKARGAALGGDRGYRPSAGPCAASAAKCRAEEADRAAHRLSLEIAALQAEGVITHQGLARALTERGLTAPRGGGKMDAHDRGAVAGAGGWRQQSSSYRLLKAAASRHIPDVQMASPHLGSGRCHKLRVLQA